MADRQIVVWNANTGTLQCVQVGDGATMTGDLTIVGNIAVSGTVDGQDLAVLGTKLGLITITGSQNIDNIATDVATAKAATDFLTVTGAINLDTVKTKTDNITVTAPVNLDDLASIAASLDQGLTYQGDWDASLGVFPTSTLTGELWRCSVAGTIDTNNYEVGDFIFALVDGASTTLSSSWGWLRTNQTHVRTVNSKSGDVTLVEADISDLQTYLTAVDIDSLAKLNALISDSVVIENAINTFAGLQVLVADETLLAASSIDTLAELNAIVTDATLGDSADFATAAQGALADSALQPGDVAALSIARTQLTGDEAITTGVAAYATGGQGNATQLTTGLSVISTCATDGDSVKAPECAAGRKFNVRNEGAAMAYLYPSVSDKFGEFVANAAVPVTPGTTVSWIGIDATTWIQL